MGLTVISERGCERCILVCDGRGCTSKVGPIFGENKIKRMFLARGWENTACEEGEKWVCPECARGTVSVVVTVIIPEANAPANGYDEAPERKIKFKKAASG